LTLQGNLTDLEAAYKAALTGGIKSYKFDSGEGNQAVVYHSAKDLKDLIDDTRAEINAINMKLRGTNLMNFNLRRQTGIHPRSGGRGCR
jgi:hypothetical protein